MVLTVAYQQEAADGELSLAELQEAAQRSEALGVRMVIFDPEQPPDAIVAQLQAEGGVDVIVNLFEHTVEVARQLVPRLKLVQGTLSGYDEYHHGGQEVMDALRRLGVDYSNNGGANAAAVAEHTVMLMLMSCKDVIPYIDSARAGQWRAGREEGVQWRAGQDLQDQTIGIVGFGNIGRLVARLLGGFGCRLLYHDIVELPIGRRGELGAEAVPLEQLLREADIVTVHVPNLPSTKKMMSADEFRLMKYDAIYVSTCRGPVTDEAALVSALREGEIGAAALDVLEVEPPRADNPLLTMRNVIVTPHVAPIGTKDEKRHEHVFGNIERLRDRRPLLSVMNANGEHLAAAARL
jgi:phosphoglycerate dehydrogenase-like enzyme